MKFILGRKQNMTQFFSDEGTVIPVTIVKAGPCYITQIKNNEKDGYQAVQIGFEETRDTKITKPERGHLKKINKNLKKLKEFRIKIQVDNNLKIGDEIKVDKFEVGDKVQVTGISKGKGFQGVVKRHNFAGSPASHGHKDQLRMPGSIGATDPGRVFKGKRMAGHMGAAQITIKNLQIVKIDPENNHLYLKGALPGARGTLIKIQSIT